MNIPYIEVETAKGIREVSLQTHLFQNGRIFLTGEINTDAAEAFLKQILYLEEQGQKATVIINSHGGEVNAGLMIYDILQAAKIPVDLYCTGTAASMAAILLAGGKKGHRFILPHSTVMIHEPLIAGGFGGSASSIRDISDSILETRDIVNGILAKHTGKTVREINELTRHDHYMNAEEAVEFGICDAIAAHV